MLAQTLFSLLAVLAVNAQTITTPAAVIQCQPARFDLSGGTAPYIVDVIPAGQVSAPAIAFIGSDLPAGGLTWTPDLPAGSNVTFRITDANGSPQYSSPTVIQQGNTDSCLNSSATSGIPTAPVTTTNTASVSASGSSGDVSLSTSSGSASTTPASSSQQSSSAGGATTSSPASQSSGSASGGAASGSATSSPNGAYPTGVAGAGALAAGVIGGIAMLF